LKTLFIQRDFALFREQQDGRGVNCLLMEPMELAHLRRGRRGRIETGGAKGLRRKLPGHL